MAWFLVFLVFIVSCGKSIKHENPQDLVIAFWNMAFYSPSQCEDFMSQNMAVAFGYKLFAPASKEQAKVFCENLPEYTKLYTKPVNITAETGTEYEKDKKYLMYVLLHHQRGEPTRISTFVVKLKDKWYIVP
ncbi:MAG: hypothetical protein ACK4VK_07375 [Aquificaceae bacterium]